MITEEHLSSALSSGGNIIGTDGDKIGGIGQAYLDDETGQPSFATVKTGLFGTSESFVPLSEGTVQGSDIVVPYTKEQVKNAPRVDPDGHLSPAEQDELYRYYELGGQTTGTVGGYDSTTAGTGGYDDTTVVTDRSADTTTGTVGHDTSGPTTDDAMTRSEERLHVGTEKQEAGRARLRKYIVTENVTQTVPVSHEEVRIEREPITDANRGDALSGADLSEEEHEVTLHEERPVVEKETVPVERVRLGKETVTEEETVTEGVRKEQIDTEGVDGAGPERQL